MIQLILRLGSGQDQTLFGASKFLSEKSQKVGALLFHCQQPSFFSTNINFGEWLDHDPADPDPVL